jgi:DNA-directed RNA polymerase specialized sigma24 family protein
VKELTEEEVKAWLAARPKKKAIRLVSEVIVDEYTTYKDLFGLKKEFDVSTSSKVKEHQSDTLRPRFDQAMLYDALTYQLENKSIPTDVFNHIQDLYKMDAEWLRVAKHTPINEKERREVANEVVKKNYPVVIQVEDKGMSVKDAIRNGRSPTQQVRTISKYISLSDRVDELEKQVAELSIRQNITESRLDCIEGKVDNPQKMIALRLTLEGRTQKEISELLNVNIRTIKRWLKKE